MPIDPRVSVGVAAIVVRKNSQVLLLKRQGKHAAGLWSLPGGWVDFGEELETAVVRELREETGLREIPGALLHLPEDKELVYTTPAELLAKQAGCSLEEAEERLRGTPPEELCEREYRMVGIKRMQLPEDR